MTGTGLVVYRDTGGVDAINEYSIRLVRALCDAGAPARYVPDGLSAARRLEGYADWILLQYNPFSYGHWGVAPGLIRDAIALRSRTGALFAVSIHEPWVDIRDWRSALISAYQRVQLRSLLQVADRVIVTTEAHGRAIRCPAVHVPVGSNVTPLGLTRERARQRLGLGEELVVTLFGTAHPSRALDHAEAGIAALAAQRGTAALKVLNLGHGSPRLRLPREIDVLTSGRLEPDDISLRLHASDVLLLPFTDGVSSRRTTLMAGLAHGVPVVGLRGRSTDHIFLERTEALRLTPFGDTHEFAREVAGVCADENALRALGEAGRRLYRAEFDWPVAAQRVRAAVTGYSGGRRSTTQA